MMRALWSAASGMKGQQTNMDVIANNIANVNTYGGKKVRAEFQDLVYQTLRDAGAQSGQDSQFPTGMQVGLGTKVAATNRVMTQGSLQTTDNPTDIGIQGEGFFRITMPDGTTGYTRDGAFKLDSNRRLVTTDGYPLADGITIDATAPSDSIVISGTVRSPVHRQVVRSRWLGRLPWPGLSIRQVLHLWARIFMWYQQLPVMRLRVIRVKKALELWRRARWK